MKYFKHDRYEPMETALKRVGLKVICVEKHGKKIVITVTRYGQPERRYFNCGTKFLKGEI